MDNDTTIFIVIMGLIFIIVPAIIGWITVFDGDIQLEPEIADEICQKLYGENTLYNKSNLRSNEFVCYLNITKPIEPKPIIPKIRLK